MGGPTFADARPGVSRTAHLRDGVFFAAVGADIVVLDRRSDGYNCLPDAARIVHVEGGRVSAPSEWIAALAEAGLTADEEIAERPPLPAPPIHDVSGYIEHSRPGDAVALARAAVAGWRHGPEAPVDILVRSLPPATRHAPDPGRAAAVVRAFQRLSPWLPRQGACLFRSAVLLRALRFAGENATWVFGVRTWPFSAHCWLQIDDAVLDDDPERVALYTPIMAV